MGLSWTFVGFLGVWGDLGGANLVRAGSKQQAIGVWGVRFPFFPFSICSASFALIHVLLECGGSRQTINQSPMIMHNSAALGTRRKRHLSISRPFAVTLGLGPFSSRVHFWPCHGPDILPIARMIIRSLAVQPAHGDLVQEHRTPSTRERPAQCKRGKENSLFPTASVNTRDGRWRRKIHACQDRMTMLDVKILRSSLPQAKGREPEPALVREWCEEMVKTNRGGPGGQAQERRSING